MEMVMTRDELLIVARKQLYVAVATVGPDGGPQAATMRCAVSDEFELVLGTLSTSRKFANLQRNPEIAVVMWDPLFSLQIEGRFDVPEGAEGQRIKRVFARFFPADFRDRDARPQHLFFRVTPRWLRYCDFADEPARVTTHDFQSARTIQSVWPLLEKGL